MKIILIKSDNPEWDRMWHWLEVHPMNAGLEDPTLALHKGEAWQYMGTSTDGKDYIHMMRHRCHPLTNEAVSLNYKSENL